MGRHGSHTSAPATPPGRFGNYPGDRLGIVSSAVNQVAGMALAKVAVSILVTR